ncbi:hypothetical protein HMPREF3038_00914 [Akkermansia sp. KLE1797]|nr:hypothetical protein HMPREF3038_00914 [Akkermansia sp. KLE1797]
MLTASPHAIPAVVFHPGTAGGFFCRSACKFPLFRAFKKTKAASDDGQKLAV